MGKGIGSTTVICPNCGEDNSASFRFCGMCGTPLEARRPAGAPRIAVIPESSRTPSSSAVSTSPGQPAKTVPSIGSPSLLGLTHPAPDVEDVNGPSIDTLRDKSFSGLDSFFEPEEPKVGGRRIFLLLALLVALGAAGWWAYSNYDEIGSRVSRISQPATQVPAPREPASDQPTAKAETTVENRTSTDAGTSEPPRSAPPAPTQSTPPPSEPAVQQHTSEIAKTPQPAAPTNPKKVARAESNGRVPPPSLTAPDTGDAALKKGEAFLYGRGVPENCDEAVKNLKAASAKQNAKARSTFGTMYATGHCVPRDLPTSYSWFALALRVDPNNQILEKDLVAVWNQMTPPERQIATKTKQ